MVCPWKTIQGTPGGFQLCCVFHKTASVSLNKHQEEQDEQNWKLEAVGWAQLEIVSSRYWGHSLVLGVCALLQILSGCVYVPACTHVRSLSELWKVWTLHFWPQKWEKVRLWFVIQQQTSGGTLGVQWFTWAMQLSALSSMKLGEVAWKLCSDEKCLSSSVVLRNNCNKVTRLWNFGLLIFFQC